MNTVLISILVFILGFILGILCMIGVRNIKTKKDTEKAANIIEKAILLLFSLWPRIRPKKPHWIALNTSKNIKIIAIKIKNVVLIFKPVVIVLT